jgi:hypothetical protein
MQKFKPNDLEEQKFIDTLTPIFDGISSDLDDFYQGAYRCFLLGDVLYDTGRDPLVGVINRSLYRSSFFAIHELFTRPGTFEFYLDVLRAIFGQETEIEFVIPSPGVLEINVPAANYETFNILAREIIDGVYHYFPLVTSDGGEEILGQGFISIYTPQEINGLIKELAPNGIHTTVNLTEE